MKWVGLRATVTWAFVFLSPCLVYRSAENSSQSFDPNGIQILLNPDIDIVYHTLAHFSDPNEASNLYSAEYLELIRQAKQDLEVQPTRLDSMRVELERSYQQMPRLRFLNLAPFMADDYASFKQALLMIDYDVEKEHPEDSRESLEERKAEGKATPLMFGNTKRLIPLFRKRFPEPAERQFVRQFAECMDEEQNQFYKQYREARSEIDQQSLEKFTQFWHTAGQGILWPWAARSRVSVFNIFLSPVMKNNGRGVPVNQDQRVIFNVVAPLPETRDMTLNSFFVILHETTHRITDPVLDAHPSSSTTVENLVFYADHIYLKTRYSQYHAAYLKFFLAPASPANSEEEELEREFLKSYPLPRSLVDLVDDLVKKL